MWDAFEVHVLNEIFHVLNEIFGKLSVGVDEVSRQSCLVCFCLQYHPVLA